jgi:CRP/FNR family transcriptional regulator
MHESTKKPCQQDTDKVVEKTQPLKRKELLYSYRDTFKHVYAVRTGAIKTFQIDMNGQERIHGFYLPGEIIGLEAIDAGYYPYSAIALTASSVCEIPFNRLLDYVATFPYLQRQLITTISHRMNQGQYTNAPTSEQRLASFILDMADRLHGNQLYESIDLPMSRYDIGNYLGLAPETVSRMMTRFQQSDLIHAQHKKITLLNVTTLQWIAQDGFSVLAKECN